MTQRTKHLNGCKETKQRDEMNYKPNTYAMKGKTNHAKKSYTWILHTGPLSGKHAVGT